MDVFFCLAYDLLFYKPNVGGGPACPPSPQRVNLRLLNIHLEMMYLMDTYLVGTPRADLRVCLYIGEYGMTCGASSHCSPDNPTAGIDHCMMVV